MAQYFTCLGEIGNESSRSGYRNTSYSA